MDPGGLACRAGVKLQMKLRDFQGIDVRNQSFEQTMNMIRATPRPWKLSFDMMLPDPYTIPICSRRCVVCRRRGLSIARQFNSCAFLRQPFASDERVSGGRRFGGLHYSSLLTLHSSLITQLLRFAGVDSTGTRSGVWRHATQVTWRDII